MTSIARAQATLYVRNQPLPSVHLYRTDQGVRLVDSDELFLPPIVWDLDTRLRRGRRPQLHYRHQYCPAWDLASDAVRNRHLHRSLRVARLSDTRQGFSAAQSDPVFALRNLHPPAHRIDHLSHWHFYRSDVRFLLRRDRLSVSARDAPDVPATSMAFLAVFLWTITHAIVMHGVLLFVWVSIWLFLKLMLRSDEPPEVRSTESELSEKFVVS